MPTSSSTILRTNAKIGREDFFRLLKLTLSYKWLERRDDSLYELWCSSKDEKEKDLLELLFQHFIFLNSQDLEIAGAKIAKIIEKDWSDSPKRTYVSAICDNSSPDGSLMLLQSIKNQFSYDWSDENFINSIAVAMHEVPDDSTLILLDDFIGSGTKIVRKTLAVKKCLEERKANVKIKIISLAAMEFAKSELNKLCVPYEAIYWLKKGISEALDSRDQEWAKESMKSLETQLSLPKGYSFGFKSSETLFCLEACNIPNNNFPIFWWPRLSSGNLRPTLFKRSKKKRNK
jgi:hypothetical protein